MVYVWVDARTNYMSALGFGARPAPLFDAYWPAQVHLVGKDILRFHAVYWPAFLLSAGLPLPECVYAHGWRLRDEAKMSKSLGNVVRPGRLLDAVGPDALRYFLLREMTFGLDGTYSDEQLLDRYNGDLANDLGNLSSRILALLETGCRGALPAPSDLPEARELEPAAEAAHRAWREAFDAYDFSAGLAAVWLLTGEVNRYLVRHAPWALAKDPAEGSASGSPLASNHCVIGMGIRANGLATCYSSSLCCSMSACFCGLSFCGQRQHPCRLRRPL